MTDTQKFIVNLLELEARKQHTSVRQFCLKKGIAPSAFSEFTHRGRDIKLSTFLAYLRKLNIEIGFRSGFDGTTHWHQISDQLSIDPGVTK